MDKDTKLFKNTSFSDIMRDIYEKTKKREKQIDLLISNLKPLVKSIRDAAVIVPLIKEYLEIAVKSDDQLVKLSAVIQRLITTSKGNDETWFDLEFTDEEKSNLLREAEKLEEQDKIIDAEIIKEDKKIETIEDQLEVDDNGDK